QLALAQKQAGIARVIPIIVRSADWKHSPIGHLHPLPIEGKPINLWSNEDEALLKVAEGIRGIIDDIRQEPGTLPIVPHQTISNIPYTHNYYFTGRDEVLSQLRKELDTSPQAISGLGGVGKTRLAVEYAYGHYQNYEAVLWVSASTRETLVDGYLDLVSKLKIPLENTQSSTQADNSLDMNRNMKQPSRDEAVIRKAVIDWLQSNSQWLLIFDHADEPGLLKDFLPALPTGHILLTTRTRDLKRGANRVLLRELDEASSALLLLRRTGRQSLDAPLEQAKVHEQKLAYDLAYELGGLPLALEQAGAYIDKAETDFSDYLSLYRTYRSRLLNQHADVPDDYSETVATTWNISFERMVQRNAAAADLFHFCAFLAPDAIPEEMITKGAIHLGRQLQRAAEDAFAFSKLLEDALSYSLLGRDRERKMLLIHRLVQAVLYDSLDERERREWQERVIKVLAAREVFPWPEFKRWEQCKRVIPHALECLHWQNSATFVSLDMGGICRKVARYFMDQAQYREAEPILQQAFSISEQLQRAAQVSAPDPSLLYDLASLYHVQGHFQDAEYFYKQALSIYEQLLAIPAFYQDKRLYQHQLDQITGILNNLAVLYYHQERYLEAEPYSQRALDISTQLHGREHPDTAQSINNLAELYRSQQRYDEAEPLFQQALALRKRV
ncbi:MAG: tetratricopeptide repeat protein, partial [Ktedonobacteraceae bacterium]|nr:tetratricopeptide repeat protein [Ktedonobacteraceae bacterium]